MSIVYTIYISASTTAFAAHIMLEYRKKKTARRILYSPWTLLALAMVCAFMLRATWNVYQKERTSADALSVSNRELDKLSTRQAALSDSVSYLSTPQGVETEIRKKFRAVKEGEAVAVILEDASTTSASSTAASRGFWGGLWHWFTGK